MHAHSGVSLGASLAWSSSAPSSKLSCACQAVLRTWLITAVHGRDPDRQEKKDAQCANVTSTKLSVTTLMLVLSPL